MSTISDIATYLQTNGVGTLGTDIFYSYVPGNTTTGVWVLDTAGPTPDAYVPTKRPNIQIFVRAVDYDTGKTKFDIIRNLLHKIGNQTIGNTYFYYILAISEGGHIGRNEAGQDEFSISFDTLIQ
jgi:hypothetical protein